MGYTTFQTAKSWIAEAWGQCNDDSLGDALNRIREQLYNMYADLPLFLDAVECFRVHRFCLDCNTCSQSYLGFTLPRECQTIEAMWYNDWPVALRSSWREFQVGIAPECDCRLQKFDVPGFFSLAIDLPHNRATHIQLVALNPADYGKRIVIRGEDSAGRPYSEEFRLAERPVRSSIGLKFINPQGGVIKEVTNGRVLLMDDDSRIYGQYEPDETVPSYKRVKVVGLPSGCDVVNVRCARRYFPLHGPDDVVETDNRSALDSMARYLRIYTKSDKSREDLSIEKDHLATARAHLFGQLSREVGKATRQDVRIVTPPINFKRLRRTY